jgi:hypothetical protein
MAAACSEGGRVEVNRSSTIMTKSLRKRTVVGRSEGGVEALACSGDRDEAAACSRATIVDERWRQQHGRF